MDFFLSDALVPYEIGFLVFNLLYLAFHFLHSGACFLGKIRNLFRSNPVVETGIPPEETATESPAIESEKEHTSEETIQIKANLSPEEKQQILEIIKVVKMKIARGEFTEARARIVEGMAIDKFNKELNCLLASLYERDHDYKRSELIYKDLIITNDDDPELYLKLGFALSMQGKYEIAYEVYKKLFSLNEANMEAAEMLANLANQLAHHEDAVHYAKLYLKKHPRHVDILYLLAISHINLSEKEEALETLKKIKTIEPYNARIDELIEKTKLEIELSKNFQTPQAQE